MKIRSIWILSAFVSMAFLASCGVNDADEKLDTLKAKIDESSVTFITDLKSIDGRRVKAGQNLILKDVSLGNPDSWEWSFSDNSPSQTTQNIEKKWTEAVGEVMIILKVNRSEDSSTDSDTLMIQVGPVEILNSIVYAFEDQDADFSAVEKWFFWSPNAGTVSIAMETNDGANGTSQSLKLTAQPGYSEFQLRTHENGGEYLASLKSNTSYVFSFYLKANTAFSLSEANVLNVKNDAPKEGWYTPFWSGDATVPPINVTTTWTKYSFEFTTADLSTFADEGYSDGTADHTGPFFKHFGNSGSSTLEVWFDEISLKEKETN